MSSIFLYFTKAEHLKNYEKHFLFHLESSFRSRDLQIFVFLPFLFTVFRFKRPDETRIVMKS